LTSPMDGAFAITARAHRRLKDCECDLFNGLRIDSFEEAYQQAAWKNKHSECRGSARGDWTSQNFEARFFILRVQTKLDGL